MRKAAVLGAASTGKTTLVWQLAEALRAQGDSVDVATVYLDASEPQGLRPARNHTAAQASDTDWLLADVSLRLSPDLPLLLSPAHKQQLLGFDTLLLTGLDLHPPARPGFCLADGDSAAVAHQNLRRLQDAWLRASLGAAQLAFQVVYGRGDLRWQQALAALGRPLPQHVDARVSGQGKWLCERCSDPACERRLFGGLLSAAH
jgi:hypothetical protein